MGDAKCPKCLGTLERLHFQTSQVECVDCRQRWSSAEDCQRVAWYEPRDRLPTPNEVRRHLERYGENAGFMASQGVGWHSVDDEAEMEVLRGFVGESWRAYPHVGGRPVGWSD